MLPNYTIYRLNKDTESFKKGIQIIAVQFCIPHINYACFAQGYGIVQSSKVQDILRSGSLDEIASRGNSLPISQVHPSLLQFYQDQLGLSTHYSKADLETIKTMYGTKYLTDSLSRLSSTLHSISEVLEPPTLLPTIVGKVWEDFIESLDNVNQLGMIPAIIEELSKVTLTEEVNSLEVSIEGFYKLYFEILSVVGRVVILKLKSIQPS